MLPQCGWFGRVELVSRSPVARVPYYWQLWKSSKGICPTAYPKAQIPSWRFWRALCCLCPSVLDCPRLVTRTALPMMQSPLRQRREEH